MYFELKSVNVWTMIKIWFFLNLILGLGLGVFYTLFSVLTMAAAGELLFLRVGIDPNQFSPGQMLVMLPIAFALGHAVFGTLLVAVLSVVYNISARLVGGLHFEMVSDDEDPESELPPEMPAAAPIVAVSTPAHESDYAPPPPPPPPLGTVRPDVPHGIMPPPVSEPKPPVPTPGPFQAEPVAPAEDDTPTADWPLTPKPDPSPAPNDKPEDRTES
jgi:hypothetical protein